MKNAGKPILSYLYIAVLLQVVWGLTPTASKIVISEIPVELYITLRWSLSSFIFLSYLFVAKKWEAVQGRDLIFISMLGLLGYGVASFGTLYGLKIGGVANFALMAAISPVISSLFSVWILKEKPKKIFFFALALSVLGLFFIVFGKYRISTPRVAVMSALFILVAYVCEALVFVYSKRFKARVNGAQYLAIAQSVTATFMWLSQGIVFHQTSDIFKLSLQGLYAILFVSVVSCVLCFAVLYWLLNHIDGHRLALFDGLHTISAVIFGWIIFKEELRPLMLIGGGLILGAIVLSNWSAVKLKPNE